MDSEASLPSALGIVGMGRSGTSLVSSLLQSGGLHIGERLMGAGTANVKGHFEDLDFFEFHVQVLRSQGISSTGFTLQRDISVGKQYVRSARALIEERRRRGVPWGWKEPRTTLFLDFWQQMIPEANFLILYRRPWDVVDSLFRRGDKAFLSDPSFAVKVWIHYNRLLLDFHERFPERCLCMNSYRVVQSPALLRDALQSKFGLDLGPLADLYDASLLHRLDSSRWASLVGHHFPETVQLYKRLNDLASQTRIDGISLADDPTVYLPAEDWAFQDWLDVRVLEKQKQELRRQLEKSAEKLSQVSAELAQAQTEKASLDKELQHLKEQWEQSQADLWQAQAQFRLVTEQIANLKSSKFWRLKAAWIAGKNYFGKAG